MYDAGINYSMASFDNSLTSMKDFSSGLEKLNARRNIEYNNNVQDIFTEYSEANFEEYKQFIAEEEEKINKTLAEKENVSTEVVEKAKSDIETLHKNIDIIEKSNEVVKQAESNITEYQTKIDNLRSQLGYMEKQEKDDSHNYTDHFVDTFNENLDKSVKESTDFNVVDIRNQIEYYESKIGAERQTIKNQNIQYSFNNTDDALAFHDYMLEKNVKCDVMTQEINGQFVCQINSAFVDFANAYSKDTDIDLKHYEEKQVNSNLTDYKSDNLTVAYNDQTNHSFVGEAVWAVAVHNTLQTGMKEMYHTINDIHNVGNVLLEGESFRQRQESLLRPLTHNSVLDNSYEMIRLGFDKTEKQVDFVCEKYGISKEKLSEINNSSDKEAKDIFINDTITANTEKVNDVEYAKSELSGVLNKVEKLNVTDLKKYGVTKLEDLDGFKINEINTKLLTDLQGKLVGKDGKSLIVGGRLDIARFRQSGLTAKDLGLTENEFNILKSCAGRDETWIIANGMYFFNTTIKYMNKANDGTSDYSWYYEISNNVNRAMKMQKSVKNSIKSVRELDFSDLKLSINKNDAVKKVKPNKNKDSKLNTAQKKVVVKDKSKEIAKAGKKEAERLAKQEHSIVHKVTNFKSEVTQSVVSKSKTLQFLQNFVGKLKDTVMSFFKQAGMYIAIAVGILLCVCVIILFIVAIVTSISELFSNPDVEQTVVYHIYEHLTAEEEDWLNGITDPKNLWKNKDSIYYGSYMEYTGEGAFNKYIDKKVEHARAEDGTFGNANIFINPFNFTPNTSIADKVEKKLVYNDIDALDGGVEIQLVSNFNIYEEMEWTDTGINITDADNYFTYGGGHTCNIKDIICMMDVAMGFDIQNAGDNSQNMTNSAFAFECKNTWAVIQKESKKCGLGIASIFNDDAYAEWTKVDDAGGGTISYARLQAYVDGLFQSSHQEKVEYEVLFFPLKNTTNTVTVVDNVPNPDAMDINASGYGFTTDSCTGKYHLSSGEYACSKYDDFKYYWNGSQFVCGILGADGYMHECTTDIADDVGNITSSKNIAFESGNGACMSPTMTGIGLYQHAKSNNCWTKTQDATVTITNEKTESTPSSSDVGFSYTLIVNGVENGSMSNLVANSGNSISIRFREKKYKSWDEEVETSKWVYGHNEYDEKTGQMYWVNETPYEEKSSETKTFYQYWYEDTTYTWDCKGHTGYYCGGHLKANVTGVVYSFDERQIHAVDGEGIEGVNYEINPPFVDITTNDLRDAVNKNWVNPMKTGLHHGINLLYCETDTYSKIDGRPLGAGSWADSTNVANNCSGAFAIGTKAGASYEDVPININLVENLFDIDSLILYSSRSFPITNWKDFAYWNEDNCMIALTKYSQDWEEMYGFDIPSSIGMGTMSDGDINAIIDALKKQYGSSFDESREHAIRLALSSVGNGSYSLKHHFHGYKLMPHGNNICTTSDCSGFVSYVYLQTAKDLGVSTNLSQVSATDALASGTPLCNSDFSNCLPADALININGGTNGGGNHTLLFIGRCSEDIELKGLGVTVPAYGTMTVDCTTITAGGNIYFRNYGDQSVTGFPQSAYIKEPQSKGVLHVRSFK